MKTTEPEGRKAVAVEVEVTNCPECGAEWEVVTTQRTKHLEAQKANQE